MIISNICRGFGNQMFRYAAGRALSLRKGCPLKLDISWFDTFSQNSGLVGPCTVRQYLLPVFGISCEIATKDEIDAFTMDTSGRYRKWSLDFPLWPEPLSCVCSSEPRRNECRKVGKNIFSAEPADSMGSDGYWEDFSDIVPPAYIHGNFLCERYFKDIRGQLLKDFTFPELPEECLPIRDSILSHEHSISLHVRHGDYLKKDSGTGRVRFVVIDIDYYKRALEYIFERVSNPAVYVFSDDMDWCREHLGSCGAPVTFVDLESEATCYHDMNLMSLCRHHIIANSTFSWWGAWIARKEGITCSPEQWYQEEAFRQYNPSAEGWIRIANGSLHSR